MAGDMKQGLTSSRPKMSILPRIGLIYGVRPLEYGSDKYARGNYHGPPPPGVSGVDRLLGYLDAAQRHITRVTDAINRAKGTGEDLAAACATRDEDGGGKFPPSNLPDLAHAVASLLIGVTCAVDDGLLPADPGQPWRTEMTPKAGLPQKDDPASERERIEKARRAREAGYSTGTISPPDCPTTLGNITIVETPPRAPSPPRLCATYVIWHNYADRVRGLKTCARYHGCKTCIAELCELAETPPTPAPPFPDDTAPGTDSGCW